MIIDSHVHFDERSGNSAFEVAEELARQMEQASVDRVVVLHLETQPWSPEEVSDAISKFSAMKAFVNINPNSQKAEKEFQNAIERLGFIGLKLHPRLQKFDVDSDATKRLVRLAGDLNVPVLIDAFPDGTNLMQNFNSVNYAKLALHCPKTRIIWAHMGGHYAIDFMMLAKRLPNIYMDMSYSLLYYRGSSVTQDMVYAMRSMRFERIFYGSDYPDRSLHDSLHSSIQELRNQGVNELEMKKLLESNARHFFEWSEL